MFQNFLLLPQIQDFISKNIGNDITKLALQKNPFPNTNWLEIINQIKAKTKAKDKLPTFFNTQNIIYPSKLSIEQTSSEKTAQYKATIVSGQSLIDLTGGFGIDDFYFSNKVKHVTHCELNKELSEIVNHNFKTLNKDNITCIYGDSFEILKNINQQFDWIYVDPSRRSELKGKVFMLKDCLPNIPELIDDYFLFTNKMLIKTAPILDITAGLQELQNVKTIHIVAIENEVKELLWEIEKEYTEEITIKTINLLKEKEEYFDFNLNDKQTTTYEFEFPKKYLYEPNAAIMKSGSFDLISNYYDINKLHQHSHLYTSDKIIEFPGRIFKIDQIFEYSKKEMKQFLANTKANITTRNFPETVESIRKKWNIKDGGNCYTFFTTNVNNNKIVLLCTKI
jgi:THUMP domain-like